MDFFIKESNIRGGNRGGKNLFNWNDVRLLSSRDRQSYLGSTQALGLMDRCGKWYKRDWWTHYNTPVNVYGKKDKLNDRQALLEEQKEIRLKEKEKLNEFIYGKKKKNTNINIDINKDDILSQHQSIKLDNLDNKSIRKEADTLSRPGLGMNKNINGEKENDEKKQLNNESTKIINKNNDSKDKNSNNHKSHHHHHHHHHKREHHKSYQSKNRHRNRSRSRSRSEKNKKRRNNSESSTD
jgi:hypothetical protein